MMSNILACFMEALHENCPVMYSVHSSFWWRSDCNRQSGLLHHVCT